MTRPNILLITCDQLRHDFLGYAGADFARTPNLNRLAAGGVVFSRCCTNSPICTPARIGLAAGQRPHRLGALDNNAYLPFSARTYYQQLRDHGYYVGCVGKLDLAKPDLECGRYGNLPRTYAWGFTHPVELLGRMDSLQREGPGCPYGHWLAEQGRFEDYIADMRAVKGDDWLERHIRDSDLSAELQEDTFIGDKAAEWIETIPGDRPWHLFVSFVGPHDPFNPPAKYGELFRDAPVPEPIADSLEGKPAWIRRRAERYDYAGDVPLRSRRQYAGCIALIDDAVGRILEALEARGEADNTIVLFTSDHGEMLYDHGLVTKHAAYETSMRVPLFAMGPGIDAGRRSDALVELIDVGSTLCELAGCPRQDDVDARSFADILDGSAAAHRSEAVCTEANYRGIRTERYKYIESHNDTAELYDLADDPHELANIAPDAPQLCRELRRQMRTVLMEGGCLR